MRMDLAALHSPYDCTSTYCIPAYDFAHTTCVKVNWAHSSILSISVHLKRKVGITAPHQVAFIMYRQTPGKQDLLVVGEFQCSLLKAAMHLKFCIVCSQLLGVWSVFVLCAASCWEYGAYLYCV